MVWLHHPRRWWSGRLCAPFGATFRLFEPRGHFSTFRVPGPLFDFSSSEDASIRDPAHGYLAIGGATRDSEEWPRARSPGTGARIAGARRANPAQRKMSLRSCKNSSLSLVVQLFWSAPPHTHTHCCSWLFRLNLRIAAGVDARIGSPREELRRMVPVLSLFSLFLCLKLNIAPKD